MRKSRRKLKNTLRQMIMKTQQFKIYGMPQQQFLEGSSQQYRPSLKRKSSNRQLNLPPKRIRKRNNKQNLKSAKGR